MSGALVPSLLDSIELRSGKARPTVQAHPKWELMRVILSVAYLIYYIYQLHTPSFLGYKWTYRLGSQCNRGRW